MILYSSGSCYLEQMISSAAVEIACASIRMARRIPDGLPGGLIIEPSNPFLSERQMTFRAF
jgi:hypothetical protein